MDVETAQREAVLLQHRGNELWERWAGCRPWDGFQVEAGVRRDTGAVVIRAELFGGATCMGEDPAFVWRAMRATVRRQRRRRP